MFEEVTPESADSVVSFFAHSYFCIQLRAGQGFGDDLFPLLQEVDEQNQRFTNFSNRFHETFPGTKISYERLLELAALETREMILRRIENE